MPFTYTSMESLERSFSALRACAHVPDALLALLVRTACAQCDALEKTVLDAPSIATDGQILPYDRAQTARTFGLLLAIMRENPDSNDAAATLHAALEKGELTLESAFDAAVRDEQSFFQDWAQRLPEAPSLLRFLVYASLLPSLMRNAEEVEKSGTLPEQGELCPVCGHVPLVLYAENGEQFRAICSFCRHEFLTGAHCPHCVSQGAGSGGKRLQLTAVDLAPEEGLVSCALCEACQHYLKVLPSEARAIPTVDDLRTLDADIWAARNGFSRYSPLVWGL